MKLKIILENEKYSNEYILNCETELQALRNDINIVQGGVVYRVFEGFVRTAPLIVDSIA